MPSAVEALQKGACHYLPRPLKIEEVGASRSRRPWRRSSSPTGPEVRCSAFWARRGGLKTAIFPEKNRADLDDLTPENRGDLEVVLTGSVAEIVEQVLV